MEQIYTIPVNEAFEEAGKDEAVCPFCLMRKKLEENELDLILGASMMEPDTRIKTNEQGFCAKHYSDLMNGGKALPFGLMMESHLNHVRDSLKGPGLLPGSAAASDIKLLDSLEKSCYVCSRIDYHFTRMIGTAVSLWEREQEFREKLGRIRAFCFPHFSRFAADAKERLRGKDFSAFYKSIFGIMDKYTESLADDVSFFCKKFDYRYENEPWGNAKDAPARAAKLFCGFFEFDD